MDATEEHYARLLGIESPWKVTRVTLSVEKIRVDIFIEYGELTAHCPECAEVCRVYDRSPPRRPFIQIVIPLRFIAPHSRSLAVGVCPVRPRFVLRLPFAYGSLLFFKQPFSASLRILQTLRHRNALALNYPVPLHRGPPGTFIPVTFHV
ncbi:MAG: hypothetical protein JXR25_05080 [Pontiellaceae bacterium]|nr:hypothetical protein [Pontiellaceae bacterium]MBN2784181.1 hypothetical protein [Pontiellaceae bacterium]